MLYTVYSFSNNAKKQKTKGMLSWAWIWNCLQFVQLQRTRSSIRGLWEYNKHGQNNKHRSPVRLRQVRVKCLDGRWQFKISSFISIRYKLKCRVVNINLAIAFYWNTNSKVQYKTVKYKQSTFSTSIVSYRNIFFCPEVISVTLLLKKQRNTLCYGTL